jgi:hypothetical protein
MNNEELQAANDQVTRLGAIIGRLMLKRQDCRQHGIVTTGDMGRLLDDVIEIAGAVKDVLHREINR